MLTNAIEVKNLTKRYKDFTLDNITFSLPTGCIMGLIGENGAGKSTTIKLLLDLVTRDEGEISLLGTDAHGAPSSLREQLGVVMDECCFPENLTLREINRLLKTIYQSWEENTFASYTTRFSLPENKAVKEYSKGMKMKLAIAVALSHQSKLLILDEATGGLDPVVRDEILDVFLEFIQEEDHSILISSHIISDLEKICDYITFIHQGKLLLSAEKDDLLSRYGILKCSEEDLQKIPSSSIHGVRKNSFGISALIDRKAGIPGAVVDPATLEDIMLFYIKEA